jgi:hypothetical protein
MRVVADENGWELVFEVIEQPASVAPVSATVSSNAPGSGVFRKVSDEDEATMATDPAPASGEEAEEVRLPAPARLPPDLGLPPSLAGDKTRVA